MMLIALFVIIAVFVMLLPGAGIFMDNNLVALWTLAINSTQVYSIELYTNNYTPTNSDTLSDYTLDPGASQILYPTSWGYTLDTSTHTVTASRAITLTFTSGQSGNTYYGLVLKDSTGTKLTYAELFTTPYVVPTGGGVLIITVNLSYHNC